MCGISGVQGKFASIDPGLLSHRGPDASGEVEHADTRLIHRRLSIIDLSEAGNQPMPNEDRTLWLVFNGEIYNFQELREALIAKGHRFRSASDSEVVLHGYEEHGLGVLSMLRGMFAFALFDQKRDELILARDPFGIKPLVYAELAQGFAFASELRVLASLSEFPRELDGEAVNFYFRLNYIPAPWTVWKHARKLEPGHYLKVRSGRVVEKASYYTLATEKWSGSAEDAVESLTETLQESVRLHLVSDVPVGAFLSGGLDSSIIVALAQREMSEQLQTFTISFPDVPHYDESHYAQTVAQALGTRHTDIPVTASDAQATLVEIVDHLDEPFGDSSLVPTAIVSKATREHTKVALSGDGGDEFFAGYNKYQGLKLAKRLMPLAPVIRGMAALPFREDRSTLIGDRVRQLRKLARIQDRDPAVRVIRSMESCSAEDTSRLLRNSNHSDLLGKEIGRLFDEGRRLGMEDLNLVLYADARFVLPYDMLSKVDTASMRYSLEVRVPFVDPEVATAAFSLPPDWKLRGLQRKWVLRKVAEPLLPTEIVSRSKGGFGIPIGQWLRSDLQPLFRNTLSPEKIERTGVVNPAYVESYFQEHMSGKRDRFWELWSLFVFQRWWERHFDQGVAHEL